MEGGEGTCRGDIRFKRTGECSEACRMGRWSLALDPPCASCLTKGTCFQYAVAMHVILSVVVMVCYSGGLAKVVAAGWVLFIYFFNCVTFVRLSCAIFRC